MLILTVLLLQNSNTTLVKVKLYMIESDWFPQGYSNTTLVKVKWFCKKLIKPIQQIQIQLLLKLNTSKKTYCTNSN